MPYLRPQMLIDQHVKAELRWFITYLENYNGRSIIPDSEPSMDIYADAWPDGYGTPTVRRAYCVLISDHTKEAHSISELECLNCLVAARTFLNETHTGRRVRMSCDNKATIYASRGGKARNKVLAACARTMWMLSANLHIAISQEPPWS